MHKVLVLDSDRDARYMIRKFPWIRYGFDIPEEVNTGHMAMQLLRREAYDLVLTDVRLSDMEGLEFIRQVNSSRRAKCVIVMSSCSDFEYAQQAVSMGVFDYILKPLSAAEFGSVLQRADIYLRKIAGIYDSINNSSDDSQLSRRMLRKNEQKLSNMLITGDSGFMQAVGQWNSFCRTLPDSQRDAVIMETMNGLYEAFDKKFPWVKNIEALIADGMDDSEHFEERAGELYAKLDKYELLIPNSLFRSICTVVHTNVEQGISLQLVADQLGISADYAGRIFKRKTDEHFAVFLMRTKMERGKQLLLNGNLHNYEISARLGYSNPDYFRQLFKNYTGMTPTEYRNIFRSKIVY